MDNANCTRRDFLKLAGNAAIVCSGLMAGCATTAMTSRSTSRAIDIHHHYFAPELIDEIKKHGKALGVEYFPPKQAKDNPYRIQFPNGRQFAPDMRMAEVTNRLEAMTKGNVGADHIMVGTDYPFDLGDWMAAEKIQTMECNSTEREAMLHGNARKLLRF